jgi:mono/diheme cytochrome c family protein
MRLGFPGLVLLVAGSAMVVSATASALGSSKSHREHGAQVYAANGCQHCHTIASVGGHKGPDLSSVGRTAKKDAIRKQIVYGSKIMPAFGEMLSSADVDDLVAYLRSCKAKVNPQAKTPAAGASDGSAQAGGTE